MKSENINNDEVVTITILNNKLNILENKINLLEDNLDERINNMELSVCKILEFLDFQRNVIDNFLKTPIDESCDYFKNGNDKETRI